MHTPLYLTQITSKDLLYSTWNVQCCVAAWMGGRFGGQWIHVYIWLSPFAVQLKIVTTLLTGYIPIQKKKIKVKKKKNCKVSGQADVTLIPADDGKYLCFYSQCCFSKVFSLALQRDTLKVSRQALFNFTCISLPLLCF